MFLVNVKENIFVSFDSQYIQAEKKVSFIEALLDAGMYRQNSVILSNHCSCYWKAMLIIFIE